MLIAERKARPEKNPLLEETGAIKTPSNRLLFMEIDKNGESAQNVHTLPLTNCFNFVGNHYAWFVFEGLSYRGIPPGS